MEKLPELTGDEIININGINDISLNKKLEIKINDKKINGIALINTNAELDYIKTGNILKYISINMKNN